MYEVQSTKNKVGNTRYLPAVGRRSTELRKYQRNKKQEPRDKKQEARAKRREARRKKQETRAKRFACG
jgi:hypothetical protein